MFDASLKQRLQLDETEKMMLPDCYLLNKLDNALDGDSFIISNLLNSNSREGKPILQLVLKRWINGKCCSFGHTDQQISVGTKYENLSRKNKQRTAVAFSAFDLPYQALFVELTHRMNPKEDFFLTCYTVVN